MHDARQNLRRSTDETFSGVYQLKSAARSVLSFHFYIGQFRFPRSAGRGIIASFDDERIATAVTRCGLPAVAVGGMGHHDPASGIPYVGTDNVQIGQLAAEHLLEHPVTP